MKSKYLYPLFLCFISLIACNRQYTSQSEIQNILIEKLINHKEIKSSKGRSKIMILNSDYCKEIDCNSYFQEYQDEIVVYTREDMFMRGIKSIWEIENIDHEKRVMVIKRRVGQKYKTITIK